MPSLAARANRVCALGAGAKYRARAMRWRCCCPTARTIWPSGWASPRIGGIVALLNTNLKGEALAHCITVAAPTPHHRRAESLARRRWARPTAQVWRHGEAFSALLEGFSGDAAGGGRTRDVTLNDRALLIYTSGTTGLPKAAHVSHRRVMSWTHWFAGMMGAGPDDRLYNCLPMYHSVGGVVAIGRGAAGRRRGDPAREILRPRFWQRCGRQRRHHLPVYRRIVPLSAGRRRRRCRRTSCAWRWAMGLSGDVWEAFQSRFAIPQILEFYAATEGNFSLYNVEGKAGRHRPHSRLPGAPLSHRHRAIRR